jgi:hypothetical protein
MNRHSRELKSLLKLGQLNNGKNNNSRITNERAIYKYGPHCNLYNGLKLGLDMSRESEQFSKCRESHSW